MKNKLWSKLLHNWLGIGAAIFITLLSVTGILLNHADWTSNLEIQTLAIDPFNPQTVWIARKNGLYVSTDGGKVWQTAQFAFDLKQVASISFNPQQPGQLYVLEKWGRLAFSKNGGRFWRFVELPVTDKNSWVELKQVVALGQQVQVLTSHGILVSFDQGKTWDTSAFNAQNTSPARLVKMLHSGYFFGPQFFWFYDAAAIALLILVGTGLYLWRISQKNK